MNWKKLLKYVLITLILSTPITAYVLNRGIISMYGGLVQRVDYKQFNPDTSAVIINNVNVLSPDGGSFLPNRTVYTEKGMIVSIDTLSMNIQSARIIDGKGKYLIPGLIDSHVHLFKSPNDLLLYLANGVTEIREMIGEKDHLTWREEMKEGRIGPEMYIASPRLGSFGLLEGWFMSWAQGFINIRSSEGARRTVRKLFKQGYDAIKVYSHLTKEHYQVVTSTAKDLGMTVVGHVPFVVELQDIWRSGQSEIAHFEEVMNALNREFNYFNADEADEFMAYVNERSDDIAEEMLRNDVSVTSTLWLTKSFVRQKFELDKVLKEVELVYENPGISEGLATAPRAIGWLPELNRYRLPEGLSDEQKEGQRRFWTTYGDACQLLLRNLAAKGVNIMAGTDANLPPTVPGFSLHDELQTLHAGGMTVAQTLRSATSVPADWMNSNSGKILAGRKANLVLLEKNPLENIAHTKTINTVMLNGQTFDRTLLDQILNAVKAANDASRKKEISAYENQ